MKAWPKHPVIYEINTWVWFGELSRTYKRPVNLATVPDQEWDAIASLGFDAVWFMGVWERSPAGIEISCETKGCWRISAENAGRAETGLVIIGRTCLGAVLSRICHNLRRMFRPFCDGREKVPGIEIFG